MALASLGLGLHSGFITGFTIFVATGQTKDPKGPETEKAHCPRGALPHQNQCRVSQDVHTSYHTSIQAVMHIHSHARHEHLQVQHLSE